LVGLDFVSLPLSRFLRFFSLILTDVLGRGPTPGMRSFVGFTALYTRGRVHFEGYLRTGPTMGVFLGLPSGVLRTWHSFLSIGALPLSVTLLQCSPPYRQQQQLHQFVDGGTYRPTFILWSAL